MNVFDRAEETIIVEPIGVLVAEAVKFFAAESGLRLEILIGAVQECQLPGDRASIIDRGFRESRAIAKVFRLEDALIEKDIGADQVGISGECGKGLVIMESGFLFSIGDEGNEKKYVI